MHLHQSPFRLARLLRAWRARNGRAQRRSEQAVVIRRERARADRSGGEFALVIFSVSSPPSEASALRAAARHVVRRTRITDKSGWTSPHSFWLLMPDCPKNYSLRMGRDVCEKFSTAVQKITFEVLHYSSEGHRRQSERSHEPHASPRSGDDSGLHLADHQHSTSVSLEAFFSRHTPAWKRAFDLTIAVPALVLLSPFLFLTAILVRATSRGPALFSQLRTGASGKHFRMYKFRTMVADAERQHIKLLALNEQDGPAFKLRNDPRVTPIGRILRATCLDELPQLWNVLRGDMSLVGPRPLPVHEMEKCQPWQRERLDVAPGMTCFWQVCGNRLKIAFEDWMRMDITYARQRTCWLDVRLAARTLAFVIGRRGT